MRDNLLFEAIIIGIITVFLFSIIYRIIGADTINVSDYNKILFTSFLVGLSMHIIFEIIGANEKWCRYVYK
jgi:hypothetical protein